MSDLEARLVDLGDSLDIGDGAVMAEAVMARVGQADDRSGSGRSWPLKVAAAVLVMVVGLVAVPWTREALADWFGLRGVRIEHRDDHRDGAGGPVSFELPGPGTSRVVLVDGERVLVSTIRGVFDEILLRKIVGPDTGVQQVMVGDQPGLWIDGEPHDVIYRDPARDVTVTRVAGNTLIWQAGDVLHRVEGFDDQAAAIAFARTGT